MQSQLPVGLTPTHYTTRSLSKCPPFFATPRSLSHPGYVTVHRRSLTLRAKKSSKVQPDVEIVPAVEESVQTAGESEDVLAQEEEVGQQYYTGMAAGPPEYPIAPPPPSARDSSALPAWVWVMVGVLLANVFTKVVDFIRRPKEVMTEMMMKQMANAMSKGGPPGMGAPGMGAPGMGAQNPFGFPPGGFPTPPPSSGFGSSPTTVDAKATTVPPPTPPPPPPPPPPVQPQTTAPSSDANGSATASSGFDPAGLANDATGGNGSQKEAAAAAQSFFQDAETASSSQASFFQDVGAGGGQTGGQTEGAPGAGAGAAAGAPADDATVDWVFEMMKDPKMRDNLYQFLPEQFRNPETLEMVMSNPMIKEQFKSMMNPGMMEKMQEVQGQMNDPQLQQQLDAMNINPEVLVQKLMGEPELWQLLQKPNVMEAVMDMQKNPQNVSQYMSDPEVMQVMLKMNELTFQAQQPGEGDAGSTAQSTEQQQPAS